MSMHAPSKAKKRSESTLHRDELPQDEAAKFSKTAQMLGLSVPLPSVLSKTRGEKKLDKVEAKRERNQRIKSAMDTLASHAHEVQEHQEFKRQEDLRAKQEARMRKFQRQGEHIAARAAREEEAAARDMELRQKQAELVKAHLATLRKREKVERTLIKKQMIEIDRAAAIAPSAVHIPVRRTAEIQAVRESLPVTAEEQPIMEAIEESKGNAVIVCGETGSGKTTQVPQFLWEAGYGHAEGAAGFRDGMIAVTEPRRVAAIAMARRVAEELNEPFGGTVCYHVRYQNNLSPDCKLKFMTEGILLKEMQSDFMLNKYSAIVIDEAHERSVSCDVLVGLLSRVVPLRQQLFEETQGRIKPLKLIIMSATLRVADFRDNPRLFMRPPRLVEVDVRRFPVSTHYSRKTELSRYVDATFSKVCQLHKKLPPGGVLIFLATQREIEILCERLATHYSKTRIVYEDDQYRKHALIKSRQERHATKQISGDNEDDAEVNESDVEDEFGLAKADYALDGDEDAPVDDATAPKDDFMGRTGLADDFDYGGVKAHDSDDEEAKRHAAKAKMTAADLKKAATTKADKTKAGQKRGRDAEADKKKEAASAAPSWWPSDDEDNAADWGDDDGAKGNEGDDDADAVDSDDDGAAKSVASEDEEDGEYDTLHILPLYSLLDYNLQQRVFEAPPKGKRLVVVATNIAETSITIPNIRYVIDAGRVKNKLLQKETAAQAFKIEWISQAAAQQRAGRAGRTGPGHCYRLYSTAVFSNLMPKHTDPEILRTPLESVVLMMKHLKIDHVGNFPFPSPPDQDSLKSALKHLRLLGALDDKYRCTVLGSKLSSLPVTPRYGRIIIEAIRRFGKKAPQVVAATLSICSVATTTMDVFALGSAAVEPPKALLHAGSDYITFLRAFNAFVSRSTERHSRELGLVHKSMTEAAQLRRQIEALVAEEDIATATSTTANTSDSLGPLLADFDSNEVVAVPGAPMPAEESGAQPERDQPRPSSEAEADSTSAAAAVTSQPATMQLVEAEDQAVRLMGSSSNEALVVPPLAKDEELALRRLFIVGLLDQVARRASLTECKAAGYKYDDSKTTKTPFWDCQRRAVVFVHPSSSIAKTFPPPEWVVYSVLQRSIHHGTSVGGVSTAGGAGAAVAKPEARLMMRGITIVTKQWLADAGFDEEAGVSEEIDQSV